MTLDKFIKRQLGDPLHLSKSPLVLWGAASCSSRRWSESRWLKCNQRSCHRLSCVHNTPPSHCSCFQPFYSKNAQLDTQHGKEIGNGESGWFEYSWSRRNSQLMDHNCSRGSGMLRQSQSFVVQFVDIHYFSVYIRSPFWKKSSLFESLVKTTKLGERNSELIKDPTTSSPFQNSWSHQLIS